MLRAGTAGLQAADPDGEQVELPADGVPARVHAHRNRKILPNVVPGLLCIKS